MKKGYLVYAVGVATGTVFCLVFLANGNASRAADTNVPAPQTARTGHKQDAISIQTGIVSDGEQVPLPQDADTGSVHIFLSVREIQDNNEILGRLECFLEADGRPAHVRNVNKFTGEVVATGTANYIVVYKEE